MPQKTIAQQERVILRERETATKTGCNRFSLNPEVCINKSRYDRELRHQRRNFYATMCRNGRHIKTGDYDAE